MVTAHNAAVYGRHSDSLRPLDQDGIVSKSFGYGPRTQNLITLRDEKPVVIHSMSVASILPAVFK